MGNGEDNQDMVETDAGAEELGDGVVDGLLMEAQVSARGGEVGQASIQDPSRFAVGLAAGGVAMAVAMGGTSESTDVAVDDSEQVESGLVVVKDLNLRQQAVVQKLLVSLVNVSLHTQNGQWNLDGVRVEFKDGKLIISGLDFEQQGETPDGRYGTLIELLADADREIVDFRDRPGDVFDEHEAPFLIFSPEDLDCLLDAELYDLLGAEAAQRIHTNRELHRATVDDGMVSDGDGRAAEGVDRRIRERMEAYLGTLIESKEGGWNLSDAQIAVEGDRVVVRNIRMNQYTRNEVRIDQALQHKRLRPVGVKLVGYDAVDHCVFSFDLAEVERALQVKAVKSAAPLSSEEEYEISGMHRK